MTGDSRNEDPAGWSLGRDDRLRDVYDTLRAIAQNQMAMERAGHTLDATAVVHEAYIRLSDVTRSMFNDENHYLAVAATTIRRVLVDHARAKRREKRGGGAQAITLHTGLLTTSDGDLDVIALDDALVRLGETHPDAMRLVELRFFAGLSIDDAAAMLEIGRNTAVRRWRAARAWLRQELLGPDSCGEDA